MAQLVLHSLLPLVDFFFEANAATIALVSGAFHLTFKSAPSLTPASLCSAKSAGRLTSALHILKLSPLNAPILFATSPTFSKNASLESPASPRTCVTSP